MRAASVFSIVVSQHLFFWLLSFRRSYRDGAPHTFLIIIFAGDVPTRAGA